MARKPRRVLPRLRARFDRLRPAIQPGDRWELLVVCPRCQACARLVRSWVAEDAAGGSRMRDRLSCGRCGMVQDDPPRLRWWLRTPCCGHVLWATSIRHLELLAAFVAVPLRERLHHNWPDRELLATLPRWLILARHREEVLRGLERLRRMLPAEP